ncbi:MAG: DUF1127 domain-containing protein [Rhodospirillales bacterium]|nr:DUF1127 domain-containing protein [Rhodospirillales bacterium]
MSSLHNAFLLCLLPTAFPVQASTAAPILNQRPSGRSTAGFGALARGVKRAVSALVRWRQRELIRQELTAMDDHLLADIGVRRHEIPHLFSERLRLHTPNPVSPWPAAAKRTVQPQAARGDNQALAA